jgi:fused signal recognition particle receptor
MAFPGDDDELELEEIELEDEVDEEVEVEDETPERDEEAREGDKEAATSKGNRESSDVAQKREPGRAEARIQKLANSRREAEDRATKLELELKAVRDAQENAQRTQQRFAQEQMEQERLRQQWEQASPEDRVAMMLQKQQRDLAMQNHQYQRQISDTADRMKFEQLATNDKVAAKFKTEVEARLTKTRAAGFEASREDIYKHLLGEKVMAARAKAVQEQSKAGAKNIKRQTTKARSATSDRAGGRSTESEREARRKRLEDMSI